MRRIEHWSGGFIDVAESKGGVLATLDPSQNVVRGGVRPWPPPELVQKLYASERWRGKTAQDDHAVRRCLDHYCDLQSLNSEDAITWSFFGPLIYGPQETRLDFATRLFANLNLPQPRTAALWLWRRIPHPEKLASTGGPEIDFGIHTDEVVGLGEAKWNSGIGAGQGVARNRTETDLRVAYWGTLGLKAAPSVQRWVVLGVGRGEAVLRAEHDTVTIHNLSWRRLIEFMPPALQPELSAYLAWKERYSSTRKPV
jgi:hypothetical protein